MPAWYKGQQFEAQAKQESNSHFCLPESNALSSALVLCVFIDFECAQIFHESFPFLSLTHNILLMTLVLVWPKLMRINESGRELS